MFVPREVISDNNPQEFITRYSFNDYTIKLNRCYNSGLILQKIDDHIFTFFLIKPHVTHGSVGVNICGDKWKVARRTSRNRFKYRGVINVFNPISPVMWTLIWCERWSVARNWWLMSSVWMWSGPGNKRKLFLFKFSLRGGGKLFTGYICFNSWPASPVSHSDNPS